MGPTKVILETDSFRLVDQMQSDNQYSAHEQFWERKDGVCKMGKDRWRDLHGEDFLVLAQNLAHYIAKGDLIQKPK